MQGTYKFLCLMIKRVIKQKQLNKYPGPDIMKRKVELGGWQDKIGGDFGFVTKTTNLTSGTLTLQCQGKGGTIP